MVVICLRTNAHCPMMRRAYQNWVRPRLIAEHSFALSRIALGKTINTQGLPQSVKTELFEAAFLFQSNDLLYAKSLALAYAKEGRFESANALVATIPVDERMTDNKILKVYLLQALASEKEIMKGKVASMAKQARRIWDDETRFLVASLAIQLNDSRQAYRLYAMQVNAGPRRRTSGFYQIIVLISIGTKDHKTRARKMLIEGQAKLPQDFLDEQSNIQARKYFRLHIPGQAECLLELFEKIPGVKWRDDVLRKIIEACILKKRPDLLGGVMAIIPDELRQELANLPAPQ